MAKLSAKDNELVESAIAFLSRNYIKGKHHVACVLQTDQKQYFALHLDTKGYDVCAEPIALSNALMDNQATFILIVTVRYQENGDPKVCSPCGNCRQILGEYCPNIQVVVPNGHSLVKVKASELLPFPYR